MLIRQLVGSVGIAGGASGEEIEEGVGKHRTIY